MKKQKLLLQQVRLATCDGLHDVLTEGDSILAVDSQIETAEIEPICCAGKLLLPAFVDCHTHLDKAFMKPSREARGLMDAVKLTEEYEKSVPLQRVREDVLLRGGAVLEKEIAYGTGLVRSHVSVDDIWGMEAFYGSCELRRRFAGRIDVQLSVPFRAPLSGEWREAARAGEIDFIAGYPSVTPNPRSTVDELFALAERYDLPLDLHVDESDAPDISCFRYILEKTLATGLNKKVVCSHVTALAAVSQKEADEVAALCLKAEVSVVSLPSCNMYLMGRNDRGLVRRGITRIDELERAGVNVAVASDNIRDPFRPFGNGNMLEEALFACQVLSRGTEAEMRGVIDMVTKNAAAASGGKRAAIEPGAPADMILIDADSVKQAVIEQPKRLLQIKSGMIIRKFES